MNILDFLKLSKTERSNLKKLDFSQYVYVSEIEDKEDFEAFCNALAECTGLEELYLYDSAVLTLALEEEDYCANFCKALSRLKSLRKLDLGNNNFFDFFVSIGSLLKFGESLSQLPGLECLRLCIFINSDRHAESDEETRGIWIIAVSNFLKQCQSLRELNLADNAIGNLSDDFFKILCDTFTQLPALQTLELEGNSMHSLNENKCLALGNALENCQLLRTIALSSFENRIQEDIDDIEKLSAEQFIHLKNALSRSKTLLQIVTWLPDTLHKEYENICKKNHKGLMKKIIPEIIPVCIALNSRRSNENFSSLLTNQTHDTSEYENESSLPAQVRERILCFAFPRVPQKLLEKMDASINRVLVNRNTMQLGSRQEEDLHSEPSNKRPKYSAGS